MFVAATDLLDHKMPPLACAPVAPVPPAWTYLTDKLVSEALAGAAVATINAAALTSAGTISIHVVPETS